MRPQHLVRALLALVGAFLLPALAQSNAPDICASVFNSTDYYISASAVYSCLTLTPFNSTLATSLVQYWRETLQFQSTLAYLKNPPEAYQQPAVDLLAGIDLIQDQIDNGVFTNQYSFEAAVHSLLQKAHDFHIALAGGVIQAFAFTPSLALASISTDGFSLPELYDAAELADYYDHDQAEFPSAITTVNGQPAEKFAQAYAARNSYGALENHADWNQIMWSFAAAIQGYTDPFSSIYSPNSDDLVLGYANGSSVELTWYAVYIGPADFPRIQTAQEVYDYFVFGLDTRSNMTDPGGNIVSNYSNPVSSSPSQYGSATSTISTASGTATTSGGADENQYFPGWGGAYPEVADVMQPNLGDYGSWVTGYFLNDSKIGVLSIPSFEVNQTMINGQVPGVSNYTDAVREFLTRSKETGMTKILVDLRQNYGGEQLLAREVFRQFFPSIEPFSGMRTRSFDTSNELGNTMTNHLIQQASSLNATERGHFESNPWSVTNEINAGTEADFGSWQEYYGPHPANGDYFSTVYRYNFSDPSFVYWAGGIDASNDPAPSSPPYDARDITILTDSVCASTCDLFVEMMHHEVGVRTVAIGGLPQEGPMQARGSARGALALNNFQIDRNIAYAAAVNNSVSHLLLNRQDPNVTMLYLLQLNFADQIRRMEYTPLQFAYEAADCRIFWTPETYFNYTSLWYYAASAVFFNASTCVARSAEHNNTMVTDFYGPSREQLDSWAATDPANAPVNQSVMVTMAADQIDFWVNFYEDDSNPSDWYTLQVCNINTNVCETYNENANTGPLNNQDIWYMGGRQVAPPVCGGQFRCGQLKPYGPGGLGQSSAQSQSQQGSGRLQSGYHPKGLPVSYIPGTGSATRAAVRKRGEAVRRGDVVKRGDARRRGPLVSTRRRDDRAIKMRWRAGLV